MHSTPDCSDLVQLARGWARTRPGARAYTWLRDGEVEDATLTFAELDRAARAVGAELEARGLSGERALLMYSPGLPFIESFLGCLYAGVTAVPLTRPRNAYAAATLVGIARHADPAILLTDRPTIARLEEREVLLGHLPVLATDAIRAIRVIGALDPEGAEPWRPHRVKPDALAFLQYTSGSTGSPKGVEITHANLAANERMMCTAFDHGDSAVIVSWLPLFHDMGLLGNVLQSLFSGVHCVLMAPEAFIQRPLRWLRAISRYRATTSGGPNFGYELCVRKARAEDLGELDLSSWCHAYNGSEPVRAETLERFGQTFSPAGFRPEALYPCYGLAEASLFVTGGSFSERCVVRSYDSAALCEGRAEPTQATGPGGADGTRLVGCGHAWLDERVQVVDPEARRPLPDGAIGEIWVQGPNVARGYRAWPEHGEDPFRARLASGAGPFLRTGDLGFFDRGELFVTGRLDDLLILHGRNHYPQDIECVAGDCHAAFRSGCAAAFTVEARDGDPGGVRLVVVQEVEPRPARRAAGSGPAARAFRAELIGALREAVARHFGLLVWRVALIEPGSLPTTTSGKVQRRRTRALFGSGSLRDLTRVAAVHPE